MHWTRKKHVQHQKPLKSTLIRWFPLFFSVGKKNNSSLRISGDAPKTRGLTLYWAGLTLGSPHQWLQIPADGPMGFHKDLQNESAKSRLLNQPFFLLEKMVRNKNVGKMLPFFSQNQHLGLLATANYLQGTCNRLVFGKFPFTQKNHLTSSEKKTPRLWRPWSLKHVRELGDRNGHQVPMEKWRSYSRP